MAKSDDDERWVRRVAAWLPGEVGSPPHFDDVQPFRDGVAGVERGDWHGLIDRRGRFVWGPTTERCCPVRTVESEWA